MLGMVVKVALRPTPQKTEWLFDSMAMEETRPRLRTDPWRPIAQQFITGMPTFRPNLREPRPGRCKIDGLATSDIPVLAVIGRDETLHDGATMAERFRQQLPEAQVELVDGANHLVFIDRQDVVAEQLQKFLAAASR
jgi:pimeloyl-ACP methyl ester carboxylesterase